MYENFQKLLDKHNITAYKVGKDTGISTSTLTNWKNGRYVPKQDKMQIIADYFNVSLDYLLGKEIRAKGNKEKYILKLIKDLNLSIGNFADDCGLTEKELNLFLTKGIGGASLSCTLAVCKKLGITYEQLNSIPDSEPAHITSSFDEIKNLIKKRGSEITIEEKIELIKIISEIQLR